MLAKNTFFIVKPEYAEVTLQYSKLTTVAKKSSPFFSFFKTKIIKLNFIEFHTRCTYKIGTECHLTDENHSKLPLATAK